MINTITLFSVNSIMETMQRHISLMEKAKLYPEAMETQCALALFIEQVESYNLDSICYESSMEKIKGWNKKWEKK